jgi:hypothetical protein
MKRNGLGVGPSLAPSTRAAVTRQHVAAEDAAKAHATRQTLYYTPQKRFLVYPVIEDTVLAVQGGDVDQNVTTTWNSQSHQRAYFAKSQHLLGGSSWLETPHRTGEDLLREPGHGKDGKIPAKIHLGKLCQ